MRAEFSLNDVERLLGRLGAELVAVEDGATSLRCELRLNVTKPAHAQSNDAIRNLVDVLGSVLFQRFGRFHFEHDDLQPNCDGSNLEPASQKEKPQQGAGGLGGLGWGF
jgi:hypothetical protein